MLQNISNISSFYSEEFLLFGNIMLKSKIIKAIELFLTGIQTRRIFKK